MRLVVKNSVFAVFMLMNTCPAAYAQTDVTLEEVIVRGLRDSMSRSLDIKRDAIQIVEVVTADDIGKMPDQNITETLQRLTGIQIDRRGGEGTEVRIRGLDQNITLLNGNAFTLGMEYYQMNEWQQEYDNSLESAPSELLAGVEIYKTPDAAQIEGGMGGVINLKTRRAMDLDDILFAANIKTDWGADSRDAEPSAFLVIGNNWVNNFGAIFSISSAGKIARTDYIQNFSRENSGIRCTNDPDNTQWDAAAFECMNGGQSYIAPGMFYVMDTEQERERMGASLNIEWRATYALEFGFDWFHNELDITNVQYAIKHAMNTDGATGIDESLPYSIDSSHQVGVLRYATVFPGNAETNTAGETVNTVADNFVLSTVFDDGGTLRFKANVQVSNAGLRQRAGYADSEFSEYSMRAYRGGDLVYDTPVVDVNGDGYPDEGDGVADTVSWTGWWSTVVNPGPGGDSRRWFTYRADSKPDLDYGDPVWLSDPDYHTYKSHWALGSNVDQDNLALSANLAWDVAWKDMQTLGFGVHATEEDVKFTELRWLTDFSTVDGGMYPTRYNSNGSVASATTFDPAQPPGPTNAGVAEAVYYDLCDNGGIPAGLLCDINGDGYDDNQPFGPWGYFHDAMIGSKVFDLVERLYLIDAGGNPVEQARIDAFLAQAPMWVAEADAQAAAKAVDPDFNISVAYTGTDLLRGEYVQRPLSVSLYGIDTNSTNERFRASPGVIPWQTYTAQPTVNGATGDVSRYVRITDFMPSGAYSHHNVVFQDGRQIADDIESWIKSRAPDSPGEWRIAPLESWEVKQQTTALYGMADFKGGTIPYMLNIGLRVVETELEVTSADTRYESAQWLITTDVWNGQGVLLDWIVSSTRKEYWDMLPSMNFVLDTGSTTKLRFTVAKVIARPDLQELGRGFNRNYALEFDPDIGNYYAFSGGTAGNPELDPFRATQADIFYEWYFEDFNLLSIGAFFKSVESLIAGRSALEFGEDDGPAGGRLAGVRRPFNGSGGSVKGLEFIYQQIWDNGMGLAFNYTFSDSDFDFSSSLNSNVGMPGVSRHACNLMGFYENDIMNARLAYTWRDKYLSPFRVVYEIQGLENGGSEFYDEYGQWDASITWDVTDNISFIAEALNITGEAQSSYFAYPNQPMTYTSHEPRLLLGLTYRL
jgi:outer membrane receptor protein involved in Fe transport